MMMLHNRNHRRQLQILQIHNYLLHQIHHRHHRRGLHRRLHLLCLWFLQFLLDSLNLYFRKTRFRILFLQFLVPQLSLQFHH